MKRIYFIFFTLQVCFVGVGFSAIDKHQDKTAITIQSDSVYMCLPCGSSCDKIVYKTSGICGHCNMKLVSKNTIMFKKIEPASLCNFIAEKGDKKVLLLDVRSNEEFNGTSKDKFGKLSGAINIPVQELEKRIGELAKYKNKEIVVYCSHSHRSPRASYLLMQNGFTKVTNMEYGISEWQNKVKSNNCNDKLYIKQ